jgi:hypothetical protein
MLIDFLKTRRGIPFDAMFAMTEYPQDVLPLYAQGHSLAQFLIAQRGKQAFLNFLAEGMQTNDWRQAIAAHYEYEHLLALQNSWMDWVRAGRPPIQPVGRAMLASAQVPAPVRSEPAPMPPPSAPQNHAAASPSVYGENTNWTPARPAQPVTAGYEPQAAAAPIFTSGGREGVLR